MHGLLKDHGLVDLDPNAPTTLVGLISKFVLKIILHDDLHGLISVGSGQPTSQSGN